MSKMNQIMQHVDLLLLRFSTTNFYSLCSRSLAGDASDFAVHCEEDANVVGGSY